MNQSRTLNVLLVEDHEADRRLVEEALADCHIPVNLQSVKDGDQAIKYIRKAGSYKKAQRPDLIILDLNMPRMDGHEFLEEAQDVLKAEEIPVVLLTVSDSPHDLSRAMDRHMNYYLNKPVDTEKLKQILTAVSELWQPECCHH